MAEFHARYRARPSWRDRIASAAIALALVALLVLVLIRMGALPFQPPGDGRALNTFNVAPAGPKAAPARQQQQAEAQPKQAERPRATPPQPPQPLPPPEIELPGVLKLSRADFASADVGRFPRQAVDAGAAAGAVAAGGGGDSASVGSGPNGETLYNAEWVREPTHAEMATYLPPNRTGWGMVACRTVARNRVEDCQELGQTPGSGLARAVRLASFQFLVRPPRLNGLPMVGAWVRIKFDVTEGVQK